MRVIPSHLSDGRDNTTYTGSAFSSIKLILGEIQKIYQPNDQLNINGKTYEYDVWAAQIMENGTSVPRMLSHIVISDIFGSGIADTLTYTLRPSNSSGTTDTSNNKLGYGLGSRVLLLAINGDRNNYICLGGIRNSKGDPIDSGLGHNLNFEFNGLNCKINDDGSFNLTYGGATNADGSNRDDVDQDAVGTNIQITNNGNVQISDKNGENAILIDRENQKIQLTSGAEIDLNSDQINLGNLPTDPAVLGLKLVNVLTQLLVQLQALTVTFFGVPSTPPINAPAFAAIQAQLETILSEVVKLQ